MRWSSRAVVEDFEARSGACAYSKLDPASGEGKGSSVIGEP
jgi:hypothetical protein